MASRRIDSRFTDRGEWMALVHSADPLIVAPDQKKRLRASLARKGRFGIFADRLARLFDCTITESERCALQLETESAWGPGPLPGMEMIPVTQSARYHLALASFVRFTPGLIFPPHSHAGGEITFVLEGAFQDVSGAVFARGDEQVLAAGAEHHFTVLERGPCIAAAIAYEGIELV